MALIPVRVDQQVFGLLQFNDQRSNRFTPDLIGQFERMADTLAIALSRRHAEAALQESEERFRTIIDIQRHKDKIRLVLTDFAMPRMNGLETLTALRRISPGIPVILASGYSKEQVMDDGLPDQPQAFLGKPYGIQELKAAIQHSLAEEQ